MVTNITRVILAVVVMAGLSFAGVTVSSPVAGSTVSSPVAFVASASSSYPVTAMRIYVDHTSVYLTYSNSLNTKVTMIPGSHQVVVQAWDSTGAVFKSAMTLNVVSGGTAGVSIAAPANGSTVGSPVRFVASAYSPNVITSMRIYVDSTSVFSIYSNSIDTYVPLATGAHYVVIQAWDATGAVFKAAQNISVGSSGPAPTPNGGPVAPSNATVIYDIQNRPNWGKCSSLDCSGGLAAAWVYWMAPFQTTPSLSGSSAHFYVSGPAYSTAMFYNKLGAIGTASHFIHDFYVMTDSVTPVQALEFDLIQVVGGRKYNWSTECDYWYKRWDVWNEVENRWVPTNATCTPLTPNVWHRVQWAMERVSTGTRYLSVTVDGITQQFDASVAYQHAPWTAWENCLNIQIQQDLSLYPGNGVHEWIDKETVYAW